VDLTGLSVLVIDDDPHIREICQWLLESEGYEVQVAADGASGLAQVYGAAVDLMLLDLMLPDMDGLDLCREVRSRPSAVYLPIIMVTALADPSRREAGFAAGADDYVHKPFDVDELRARVRVWAQTRQRLKALHTWLEDEQERRYEVERQALQARLAQAENQAALLATVKILAAAIETRDPYTAGHVQRVAAVAVATAQQLGWAPDRLASLEFAAALHDLGKIGVEDRILRKPGPLAAPEQEQMKQHTVLGARMLQDVPYLHALPHLEMARSCALYHQERYDGNGYPQGLAGQAIPLEARIVAVADTYDAMTSDRPYRKRLPVTEAIAEITRGAGTQFDPAVVAAFLRATELGGIPRREG
jgi:putative two-component system response regulator